MISSDSETKSEFKVRREVRRSFRSAEEAERYRRLVDSALERAGREFSFGLSACPTIRELLEEYLREKRVCRHNVPATQRRERSALLRFARELSRGAGDVAVDRITRADLVEWLERRLAEPGHRGAHHDGRTVSRDSVRGDLKILRQFATWCFERHYCGRDLELFGVPFESSPGSRDGRHPPRALPLHSFREALRRVEAEAPLVSIVLRAMILLGARPAAVFRLCWRDVVLPQGGSAGQVSVPGVKGGLRVDVPVAAGSRLEAILRRARELYRQARGRWPTRAQPVFVRVRGAAWTTDAYDHALAEAVRRAGVAVRFTSYTARHTAVTELARRGVSPAAIQHYAKHLRVSTQEIYRHTVNADALPAYAEIERMSVMPDDSPKLVPDEVYEIV